ncbi:hypothetical protein vseg_007939 [Gypsophila vaccaria]
MTSLLYCLMLMNIMFFVYFRYYINYKLLKKKVNQYTRQIENGSEIRIVLKDFSIMFDNQLETIVLIKLEQQGLLAKRLSLLREQ